MSDTTPDQWDEIAERFARQFHDVYERLAPSFGYETRAETRQFDPTSPNGKLMIAVCGEVLRDKTRADLLAAVAAEFREQAKVYHDLELDLHRKELLLKDTIHKQEQRIAELEGKR